MEGMKYDAFISYRHLPTDMYVAKRVHKELETVKIPKKIQEETGRKRINRVFRDQEELPIGSDLGSNIDYALSESDFLVVICSPQTKESYWVMKEIDTFISMHGRQNVLAVLVEGEPEDSFPPQLLKDENGNPVEPLAADVRATSNKERNKKIKSETLRLAASILHVDYDDLKQRHRERALRRNFAIATGVAVVALAFGVYTAYNLNQINQNYQDKLRNESKVLAATSLDILENGDRATAAVVALEGLPREGVDRPFVADSMNALSAALGSYDIGFNFSNDKILNHNLSVEDFVVKSDGTKMVSYDNSDNLYYWDLDSGKKLFEITPEYSGGFVNSILSEGFAGDTIVVVTDKYVCGLDETGKELYRYDAESTFTFGYVDFYGRYVIATNGNMTYIMDASSGDLLETVANEGTNSFSRDMVVSPDGRYIALSHSTLYEEDIPYITVVDMEKRESKSIQIKANSILDMYFSVDNCLVANLVDNDALLSFTDCPMYVEKYSLETGETIWSNEYVYNSNIQDTSYSQIRTRSFNVGDEVHNEVIFSACKTVRVLDLDTGELIKELSFDSYVERIRIGLDNELFFVGTYDGKINRYSSIRNTDYSSLAINTDLSLIDYTISNGVLVIRSYRSPEVRIMRESKDNSVISTTDLPSRYYFTAIASPDESTYLLSGQADSSSQNVEYYIYDTDSGKLRDTFEVEDAAYRQVLYVDNSTIAAVKNNRHVAYYDLKTKKVTEARVGEESQHADSYISENGKYLVQENGREYTLFNFETKKNVAINETEGIISNIIVAGDGNAVYYIDGENKLHRSDVETEEDQPILADYQVLNISSNNDGNIIAVVCTDGVLRLVDTATFEITDELPFFGNSNSLIKFSADDTKVYLQGTDLYFRIYDRDIKAFSFISDVQLNDLSDVIYDEANNQICFYNSFQMYFFDLGTNGVLGRAEYGQLYIPGKERVISIKNSAVYTFKKKNLQDLLQEEKERFGDKVLTNEERMKYRL
ncbi:MAG: TIR domain-containing protein [Pseudobutyrivibrio sp.]|nr:TIR domain-containing protein [Pseudobutyrivibrio sp.]